MLALPAAARPLLLALADPLIQPTAQRLLVLAVGAVLTTGRRTVTRILAEHAGLAKLPADLKETLLNCLCPAA